MASCNERTEVVDDEAKRKGSKPPLQTNSVEQHSASSDQEEPPKPHGEIEYFLGVTAEFRSSIDQEKKNTKDEPLQEVEHEQEDDTTLLLLSLSATSLMGNDLFALCDPMAVLYTKERDGKPKEIGRTEVLSQFGFRNFQ